MNQDSHNGKAMITKKTLTFPDNHYVKMALWSNVCKQSACMTIFAIIIRPSGALGRIANTAVFAVCRTAVFLVCNNNDGAMNQ